MSYPQSIVIANFGGPRSLCEITSFLTALLGDQEVLRTPLPAPIHRALFSYVAKRRARKIAEDYEKIGGKSPIFDDTEHIAQTLETKLKRSCLSFHRYLPATHGDFLQKFPRDGALIFPMFPQFSYTTTGSIALFFARHLTRHQLHKTRWIPSYSSHPAFIKAFQHHIADFLKERHYDESEVFFIFSSHGLPQKYIDKGDIYESECRHSYRQIARAFPKAHSLLSFQSKFGPGAWLKPYTEEVSQNIASFIGDKKIVVFIPLSFTSDHIETLFEVEDQYVPPIRAQGFEVARCPAFNRSTRWIETIAQIIEEGPFLHNDMLLRRCL